MSEKITIRRTALYEIPVVHGKSARQQVAEFSSAVQREALVKPTFEDIRDVSDDAGAWEESGEFDTDENGNGISGSVTIMRPINPYLPTAFEYVKLLYDYGDNIYFGHGTVFVEDYLVDEDAINRILQEYDFQNLDEFVWWNFNGESEIPRTEDGGVDRNSPDYIIDYAALASLIIEAETGTELLPFGTGTLSGMIRMPREKAEALFESYRNPKIGVSSEDSSNNEERFVVNDLEEVAQNLLTEVKASVLHTPNGDATTSYYALANLVRSPVDMDDISVCLIQRVALEEGDTPYLELHVVDDINGKDCFFESIDGISGPDAMELTELARTKLVEVLSDLVKRCNSEKEMSDDGK